MVKSKNTDTNVSSSVDAEYVERLNVQRTVDSVASESSSTVVLLPANAENVDQLNAHVNASTDTSKNTNTNVDTDVLVDLVYRYVVKSIVHSGTSTENVMAARFHANARNVNTSELRVQNTVNTDTSRRERTSVSLSAVVDVVSQLNVQNVATGDTSDATNTNA